MTVKYIKSEKDMYNHFKVCISINDMDFESIAIYTLETLSDKLSVSMKSLLSVVMMNNKKGTIPVTFIDKFFCPLNLEETDIWYDYEWYEVLNDQSGDFYIMYDGKAKYIQVSKVDSTLKADENRDLVIETIEEIINNWGEVDVDSAITPIIVYSDPAEGQVITRLIPNYAVIEKSEYGVFYNYENKPYELLSVPILQQVFDFLIAYDEKNHKEFMNNSK